MNLHETTKIPTFGNDSVQCGKNMDHRKTALLLICGITAIIFGIFSLKLQPKADPPLAETANSVKATWYVSSQGNDAANGVSPDAPFKTIQRAIDLAQPGESIYVLPGIYMQDLVSKRDGKEQAPITIIGPPNAIIKGAGSDRIIEIRHDYLTLKGFTVDGRYASRKSASSYRDKLLYVIGSRPKKGVTGLKVLSMNFKNAGGECIRLRYFSQHNEIAYSTITGCGAFDFIFKDGGKNGEGVYIGTAPEQRSDGKNPTSDPDQSNNNWIHHNTFNTNGNECVDIKEASQFTVVEYNTCTGQRDPESGGMDSRGESNTFRYNEIVNNVGAGVRLGGDGSSEGINNTVYGNSIKNNKAGGIKVLRTPQGKICGNAMSGNSKGNMVGEYGSNINPTTLCTN